MTLGITRRVVLIDSSAYFALTDPRDARHGSAVAIQRRLSAERWQISTTNYVVAETHGLVLNRVNRMVASQFLARIDASGTAGILKVVRIEPEDEARARAIIRQYDDKDFSLTDATSFAVMERLGIAAAFTFDRNFAQYGLDVLSAQS